MLSLDIGHGVIELFLDSGIRVIELLSRDMGLRVIETPLDFGLQVDIGLEVIVLVSSSCPSKMIGGAPKCSLSTLGME